MYLAPELLRGAGAAVPATDQWSLGLIAFRALAGVEYFAHVRGFPDLVLSIANDPLVPPSSRAPALSRAFDAWFLRSCARRPEERFPGRARAGRRARGGARAAGGAAHPAPGRHRVRRRDDRHGDPGRARRPPRWDAASKARRLPTRSPPRRPRCRRRSRGRARRGARMVLGGALVWAVVALAGIGWRGRSGQGPAQARMAEPAVAESRPTPATTRRPCSHPEPAPIPAPAPARLQRRPTAEKRDEAVALPAAGPSVTGGTPCSGRPAPARGASARAFCRGRGVPAVGSMRERPVRGRDVPVRRVRDGCSGGEPSRLCNRARPGRRRRRRLHRGADARDRRQGARARRQRTAALGGGAAPVPGGGGAALHARVRPTRSASRRSASRGRTWRSRRTRRPSTWGWSARRAPARRRSSPRTRRGSRVSRCADRGHARARRRRRPRAPAAEPAAGPVPGRHPDRSGRCGGRAGEHRGSPAGRAPRRARPRAHAAGDRHARARGTAAATSPAPAARRPGHARRASASSPIPARAAPESEVHRRRPSLPRVTPKRRRRCAGGGLRARARRWRPSRSR